ncbi:MAG TPA: glycosyltransferase family 2 protein [Vicinamibacterales bacterium]|nr:glycosyltransferase family 2 protein [Vicinamibacterales bacterium]
MPTAVLIVNYRTYSDLSRCLASLAPHLGAGDEIVIVDYESDIVSLNAAIEQIGPSPLVAWGPTATSATTANHPVRVVAVPRADNLGFAAGVNLAAARADAPYLLLLNPDAVFEGPVSHVLETWLTDHPDVGVAGPRVLNGDGTIQATARRFPDLTTWFGGRSTWLTRQFPGNWFSSRNLVGRDATMPIDVDWLSGACLVTRRELFRHLGGFDERFFMYWEDADYCYRVARAGYRRVYVPLTSVRHVGGQAAEHEPAMAIRAFHRSAYRMFRKHASGWGRLAGPLVRVGLWLRGEWRVRRAAAK